MQELVRRTTPIITSVVSFVSVEVDARFFPLLHLREEETEKC